MQTNIKGTVLPALNIAGTGYADAQAVLRAYGIPTRLDRAGRLQLGLRAFAEALSQPHAWGEQEQVFYIASRPLPPLPADPVGADVRPWHPVTAPIAGGPGDRRPDLLQRIIQQFQVAANPRYRQNQQGKGETYCNIAVWDVTRALGAEIPHWVVGNGLPSSPGHGRELDANATVEWLRRNGPDFGWRKVPEALAFAAVNLGRPAVAAWYNAGGIGHVAIVRPGEKDPVRGLPIAQSGARNFEDGYLVDGFGTRAAGEVEFYVHG